MIALAYVTCDKYSHLWKEWHEAHEKYWGVEMPSYFCGEEIAAPFFEQIPHESVPVEKWTTKLRNQLGSIPEEYVFVWLDDHIQRLCIDAEFRSLTKWIEFHKPDALRIMFRPSKAKYNEIDIVEGRPLYELALNTHYRVSFSPNIYRKDFLMDVLKTEETPWSAELRKRYYTRKNICAYHIDDWCENRIDHNV